MVGVGLHVILASSYAECTSLLIIGRTGASHSLCRGEGMGCKVRCLQGYAGNVKIARSFLCHEIINLGIIGHKIFYILHFSKELCALLFIIGSREGQMVACL